MISESARRQAADDARANFYLGEFWKKEFYRLKAAGAPTSKGREAAAEARKHFAKAGGLFEKASLLNDAGRAESNYFTLEHEARYYTQPSEKNDRVIRTITKSKRSKRKKTRRRKKSSHRSKR